jgi:threonine/homoserine/homoserine lactone efflux protein
MVDGSLAEGGITLLLSGVIMGFAIAAPIGPVNVEIIRRGLGEGFRAALLTGVGSTLADVVYILIAYGGADPLSHRRGAGRLLFTAGALVLLYLGAVAIRSALRPVPEPEMGGGERPATGRGRQAFTAGFVITIFNPMTIAFWLGILGAALVARPRQHLGIELLYVGSLMAGCLIWVLLLSAALHFGRSFVRGPVLRLVSAAAGVSLIGFGLQFALRAFGAR